MTVSSPSFHKICWYLVCLLFVMGVSSCQTSPWDKATFDPNLPQHPIYRKLDKEKEIFSAYRYLHGLDTNRKRTSDVRYIEEGGRIRIDDEIAGRNECRAYLKSDTLYLSIGHGDGFTSSGFSITYHGGRFYTETHHFADSLPIESVEPTQEIVYQKLTLDKPAYRAADSLYGYIDFKVIETDSDKYKVGYIGKGYFRAKVTDTLTIR